MINKHNIAEHTVKAYSTQQEEVKRMIKYCKRKGFKKNMEQWQYIAFRLGITDKDNEKEKVVFT